VRAGNLSSLEFALNSLKARAMFHVFSPRKPWYSSRMANRLFPPVLTRRRIWVARCVALAADALQLLLGPFGWAFADEAIDILAMVLLTLTLGFHPLFLPTFVIEFIPGADLLPTWTGCAFFVIGLRRKQQPPPPPQPAGDVIDI